MPDKGTEPVVKEPEINADKLAEALGNAGISVTKDEAQIAILKLTGISVTADDIGNELASIEDEDNASQTFQITVKIAHNGQVITVNDLDTSVSVQELMDAIEDKQGTPADQQRLFFESKALEPEVATLDDFNIGKGCTVKLVLKGGLKGAWGNQEAIKFLRDNVMHRGNVMNEILESKGRSKAAVTWGRNLKSQIDAQVTNVANGYIIDDPDVLELLNEMGLSADDQYNALLDTNFVRRLRALVMESINAGNCGDHAESVSSHLMETTQNQWVFTLGLTRGCVACANVPEDKKCAGIHGMDHAFCVTYPDGTDIRNAATDMEILQLLKEAGEDAVVSDSWDSGKTVDFNSFLSLNCYHHPGTPAKDRPVSLQNIDINDSVYCDGVPRIPKMPDVRLFIEKKYNDAEQTIEFKVERFMAFAFAEAKRLKKQLPLSEDDYEQIAVTLEMDFDDIKEHCQQQMDERVDSWKSTLKIVYNSWTPDTDPEDYMEIAEFLLADVIANGWVTKNQLKNYVNACYLEGASEESCIKAMLGIVSLKNEIDSQVKSLDGYTFGSATGAPSAFNKTMDIRSEKTLVRTIQWINEKNPTYLLTELKTWGQRELLAYVNENKQSMTGILTTPETKNTIVQIIIGMGNDYRAAIARSSSELFKPFINVLGLQSDGFGAFFNICIRDSKAAENLVEVLAGKPSGELDAWIRSLSQAHRDALLKMSIAAINPRLMVRMLERTELRQRILTNDELRQRYLQRVGAKMYNGTVIDQKISEINAKSNEVQNNMQSCMNLEKEFAQLKIVYAKILGLADNANADNTNEGNANELRQKITAAMQESGVSGLYGEMTNLQAILKKWNDRKALLGSIQPASLLERDQKKLKPALDDLNLLIKTSISTLRQKVFSMMTQYRELIQLIPDDNQQ